MFRKYFLLLTGSLLLITTAAKAQFGSSKPVDLALVKAQPLVVLLEEADPKELEKLVKKPDELAQYKAYIAFYNSQLQQLVPKLWHLSLSVEFRPETELLALRKAKGGQTVVLRHVKYRSSVNFGGGGVNNRFGAGGYSASEMIATMRLSLLGNGDEQQLGSAPAPLEGVYPSDIVFAIKNLQHELQATGRSSKEIQAEYAANGKQLRTKILLLDEADVKDKLSEAEIKQVYPFPCQIVPRATIETAAVGGDARYAYARLLLVGPGVTAQVVVDASEGQMLAMSISTQGVGKGAPKGNAIGKGNLKDFAKSATGK